MILILVFGNKDVYLFVPCFTIRHGGMIMKQTLQQLKQERMGLERQLQEVSCEIRRMEERKKREGQERLVRNFRLKQDHIKLLKRMEFRYFGTGDLVSIGVEGKRPFGNSSVYWDMARILGWKMEDDDPSEKQCERLERLMKELPLAVNSIIRKL